jgi:hypothetical protein
LLCRNPLFKEFCRKVSLSKGGLYSGPAYNNLREGLLERAVGRIGVQLQPFFEHARRVTGFALLCDGWTDVQGRPLLNFCLATPKGAHFLRAVDTTGNEKDAKFIFDELKKVIEEIGSEHIVAVIMDGASANTSANELLEIE